MVGLHQILDTFKAGVDAAVPHLLAVAARYATTFSQVPDQAAAIQERKRIMDIALLVLGVVSVFTFQFGMYHCLQAQRHGANMVTVIPLTPAFGALAARAGLSLAANADEAAKAAQRTAVKQLAGWSTFTTGVYVNVSA